MAGFPLTAWAIRHPWGSSTDVVFDVLRGSTSVTKAPSNGSVPALLDELAPQWSRAGQRWGVSRMAAILGRAQPPSSLVEPTLDSIRAHFTAGIYEVLASGMGGLSAWASAHRLLRASLADAVLVIGHQDDRASAGLVERHGDAFVELVSVAEATAVADATSPDRTTTATVVSHALRSLGPLGYVHCQTDPEGPQGASERDALAEVLGSTLCCTTRIPADDASARASDCGATDVPLAATSLIRGFAPQPAAHELEHDRVLLHGFSPEGRHVAVVLEARP